MNYLEEKFKIQWQYSGCTGDYKKGFVEIVKQYQKPKRYYHTFGGHIKFCVKAFFDYAVFQVSDPVALMWQLLLHDSVMDFERSDNDIASALWAKKYLCKFGASQAVAEKVANAITYHTHQSIPDSEDIKFGLDIDLLILAQSEQIFDEYECNIRKEYSFVPESVFCQKRSEILQSFLNNRPSIFLTDYFKQRFEINARKNLEMSIKKLKRNIT